MRFKDFLRLTESELASGGEQPDEYPPQYQPPKKPKIRIAPKDGRYGDPAAQMGQPQSPDDVEGRIAQVLQSGDPRKLPDDFSMSPRKFKKRVKKLGVGDLYKMKKKDAKALGFTKKDGYSKSLSRLAMRPTMNRGIARRNMPQIKDREKYIRWLMQNGVEVTREYMSPEELVRNNKQLMQAFAQDRMYLAKSYRFITKNKVYDKWMIITQDKMIFDGNHHWLVSAAINGEESIPVYFVHMNFDDLIEFTKNYPDVTYEEHWDELLGCYVGSLVFLESEYEDDYLL
jgi:hypothetical protein